MLSRRQTLRYLGIAAGGMLFNVPLIGRGQQSTFETALNIPDMASGSVVEEARQFDLTLQSGRTELLPGQFASTYGINGSYLGPTLRLNRYELSRFSVTNNLAEDSSLHWHGFHLPPTEDGGPHQPIAPGTTWNARFQVVQYGGTYWYHSHVMHKSGEQVYKGLAGMIIVDDEEHPQDLPSTYGVDDIPLILQDRRFDDEGELRYLNRYQDIVMGMMGDTILVNGTFQPQFRPSTRLVRFRILNAANARTFNLALNDGRPFQQIAGDGGLLSSPVTMNSLQLAPAERAEIVVAFNPGDSTELVSLGRDIPASAPPGAMNEMLRIINSERFRLLSLNAESRLADSGTVPDSLVAIYRIPEAAATNTRRFNLMMGSGMRSGEDRGPGDGPRNGTGGGSGGGNYFINGRQMAIDYINERVTLNTTEIWELRNRSPMMHPFHIHNGQFQLLDRNGTPPPDSEMGWKDTVRVDSGEVVRLIMRFTDYTDENNPYMYHCHILEHEDRGMMGQFVLVNS